MAQEDTHHTRETGHFTRRLLFFPGSVPRQLGLLLTNHRSLGVSTAEAYCLQSWRLDLWDPEACLLGVETAVLPCVLLVIACVCVLIASPHKGTGDPGSGPARGLILASLL